MVPARGGQGPRGATLPYLRCNMTCSESGPTPSSSVAALTSSRTARAVASLMRPWTVISGASAARAGPSAVCGPGLSELGMRRKRLPVARAVDPVLAAGPQLTPGPQLAAGHPRSPIRYRPGAGLQVGPVPARPVALRGDQAVSAVADGAAH